MTIHELLQPFDLSPKQRDAMYIAYDESPEGFARIVDKAKRLNNPPAALTSMIRQGQHDKKPTSHKGKRPAHDTFDDVVMIGITAYNARTGKYPPTEQEGWTHEDAIIYAVDLARWWNSAYAKDDEDERAIRQRLGHPWTRDQDPLERTVTGKEQAVLDAIAEAFA